MPKVHRPLLQKDIPPHTHSNRLKSQEIDGSAMTVPFQDAIKSKP